MATQKWIAGTSPGLTWTSVLTTELNTLTNGSTTALSAQLDNSTNLDMYADFAFLGGGSITPTGNPNMVLYLIPIGSDGTTYAAASTSYIVDVATVDTAAGTKSLIFRQVILPPTKYKIALQQNCGVSLTSSGNTLKYITYNESVA